MTNKEKAAALRELAAWCEKWEVEIDCDWNDVNHIVIQVDSTLNSKTEWKKLIHDTTINQEILLAEAQRLEANDE